MPDFPSIAAPVPMVPPNMPVNASSWAKFGADKVGSEAKDTVELSSNTDKKPDDSPNKEHDSFVKLTVKEAVKNGAVIGLTLLLAPLLGPAIVGAVGGAGLMSGVMFGVVVPAAMEWGLNRYEGRLDQLKIWTQKRVYNPAKMVLTPLAHSPFGRLFSKNPKQWLSSTLEKLNPENLIARLKQQQQVQQAADVAGKAAVKNPFSPQRFMTLFRQHLKHLGWGPAMLVSLHGLLAGVRQFFSVGHQLKGAKAAFGKGIRSGLAHTGKMLFRRGGLKGLRFGLFLRQALIANTVVWGAMKGINLFARLAYGKSIKAMMTHTTNKAVTVTETVAKKAVA